MPEPESSTRRRRRILIPIPLMEKTISKIFRRSIYTFLQNYHHFTTTVALLALPFSVAVLRSQFLLVSSSSSSLLLPSIYSRLRTLFHGFPSSSPFEFFTWKLSQTISSSIITLPFTLTFFLFAKASVIQTLQCKLKQQNNNNIGFRDSSSSSNIFTIFNPLLITYLCNSILILSANATIFGFLFFTLNFLFHEGSPNFLIFLFTAVGAVFYSLVLANALIICNFGLVLSGIERSYEYLQIIRKAFVLIKSGRTSVALSLALPIHLVLAAIEALFQYRIVLKAYHHRPNPGPVAAPNSCSLFFEGIFIAYLYSICGVLDTVISFIFYESCKINCSSIQQQQSKQLEPTSYCYEIQTVEDEGHYYVSIKNSQLLP